MYVWVVEVVEVIEIIEVIKVIDYSFGKECWKIMYSFFIIDIFFWVGVGWSGWWLGICIVVLLWMGVGLNKFFFGGFCLFIFDLLVIGDVVWDIMGVLLVFMVWVLFVCCILIGLC